MQARQATLNWRWGCWNDLSISFFFSVSSWPRGQFLQLKELKRARYRQAWDFTRSHMSAVSFDIFFPSIYYTCQTINLLATIQWMGCKLTISREVDISVDDGTWMRLERGKTVFITNKSESNIKKYSIFFKHGWREHRCLLYPLLLYLKYFMILESSFLNPKIYKMYYLKFHK